MPARAVAVTMCECLRGVRILGAMLLLLVPVDLLAQGIPGPPMRIDTIDATPAFVVINAPTTVTFRTTILHPSVLPTGVNLLKVDQAGKTLAIAGVMRDDGTAGDAAAGDKVFTIRLSVNEPGVGRVYYRVSAAFKGVLQRVLSSTIAVVVDPFPLPPDPGEAGKQTVAGIDSDKDGVRDDVQRQIALDNASSEKIRRALGQYSGALGQLLAGTDAQLSLDKLVAAARCMTYVTGASQAIKHSSLVRAYQLNTPSRSVAYLSAKRFGSSLPEDPDDLKPYCTFDPDSLSN